MISKLQDDWTVCMCIVQPLPDIQKAKFSEITIQTLGSPGGGGKVKNFKKENYNIKEWVQIFNDRQFRKMNIITHKKSMSDRLEAKYFEFTGQILPPFWPPYI